MDQPGADRQPHNARQVESAVGIRDATVIRDVEQHGVVRGAIQVLRPGAS